MQIIPSQQFSQHRMVVPMMHTTEQKKLIRIFQMHKTEEKPSMRKTLVPLVIQTQIDQHADRTQKYKSAQTVCPGAFIVLGVS